MPKLEESMESFVFFNSAWSVLKRMTQEREEGDDPGERATVLPGDVPAYTGCKEERG